MAMLACKECKSPVSSEAKACPKCGAPPPKPTKTSTIVIGIIAFAIVGSCISEQNKLSTSGNTTEAAAPVDPDAELRGTARYAISKAKTAVLGRMKDPDSTRFKEIVAVKTPAGGLLVCGDVNAKNALGGYVGFKPFMWTTSGTVILLEDMKKQEFAKAWNGSCSKWETILSVDS